jgi:hypothetical protein
MMPAWLTYAAHVVAVSGLTWCSAQLREAVRPSEGVTLAVYVALTATRFVVLGSAATLALEALRGVAACAR